MSVQAKLLVDAILGQCVAEVVDYNDPSANYVGWGGDIRPLKQGHTLSVSNDNLINMSDLDIDPEIKETIPQCMTKLSVDNHSQAEEACYRMALQA